MYKITNKRIKILVIIINIQSDVIKINNIVSVLFENCQPNVKTNQIVVPDWDHKTSTRKTGHGALYTYLNVFNTVGP